MNRIQRRGAAVALGAAALALSAGPALADDLPTIDIALNGSSITLTGPLQSGAVTIRSTATKEAEPTLVRLNPGVTADQFTAFLKTRAAKNINNVTPFGSVVFDVEVEKGTTSVQTVLQPGDYVAADTEESPAKAPTTAFTVAPAAAPATLPTPQARVRAVDYRFAMPARLRRGETVRFENDGFVGHMIVGFKATNARGARRITALLRRGRETPAHKFVTGFASFLDPVSPSGLVQSTITAKPGIYVMVDFLPTQDGRENAQLGQTRIFRVTA